MSAASRGAPQPLREPTAAAAALAADPAPVREPATAVAVAADPAPVLDPGGAGRPAPGAAATAPVPVLFVITTTDFGGTESFLEQLVARLDRGRFQPLVCSLCPPGRAAQRMLDAGVPVETLGMAARPRPHQLLAAAWRLARLLDRRQVALVHALLYRANVVTALACRLSRRRPLMLWGQHSQIATSEGRWTATAARWTRPLADRIVCVAAAVKESLVAAERLPRDRIEVIANGVAAERYQRTDGRALRTRLGLAPGTLLAGTVGRLAPEKGLSHLLEAAALARARGLPLALALAGDGPDRAALERHAARLGLAPHVHFLGFQRHPETLYSAFDVFVLSSLEEASPLALLEAMASGCPVIATAVGGIPEILGHGPAGADRAAADGAAAADSVAAADGIPDTPLDGAACGLLVPPASPGALARALGQLAAQPDLRRFLGAQARSRILAHYDLAVMVRRHEQLYLSLL
jgi:glycosyltransferase involved in cell wall biosynthesis